MIPNPDKPEPNRFEDKKIDHESTKIIIKVLSYQDIK